MTRPADDPQEVPVAIVRQFDVGEHELRMAQRRAIEQVLDEHPTDDPAVPVADVVTGVLVDLVAGEGSTESLTAVLVEHGLGGPGDDRIVFAAQELVATVAPGAAS